MSQDHRPSGERADWNEAEVDALLDFLYTEKSKNGDGHFKMPTFNSAATSIAPLRTLGPQKTGKMCKTKWNTVRHCAMLFILNHAADTMRSSS